MKKVVLSVLMILFSITLLGGGAFLLSSCGPQTITTTPDQPNESGGGIRRMTK